VAVGYATKRRGGTVMRTTVSEMQNEIVDWVRECLKSKKFGTFGITVTMREGMPISVERTDRLNFKRVEGNALELAE
jgi:hypothetical protein